jgi:hypothetical protein
MIVNAQTLAGWRVVLRVAAPIRYAGSHGRNQLNRLF